MDVIGDDRGLLPPDLTVGVANDGIPWYIPIVYLYYYRDRPHMPLDVSAFMA